MAKAGGGVVFLPWYATGFRADGFADALAEIAPVALRYGATEYAVYRSRDDRYKFLQSAAFADGVDFDRYWYGPEVERFRSRYASWYQVPVVPYWNDQVVAGAVELEPVGE
jgi:hypothetical protein